MTGTSPPGPFRCGSTTCSTRPVATAASKALPPDSSIAIPAADASQWVDATMPNVPASSGLVVNSCMAATGDSHSHYDHLSTRRTYAAHAPARRIFATADVGPGSHVRGRCGAIRDDGHFSVCTWKGVRDHADPGSGDAGDERAGARI